MAGNAVMNAIPSPRKVIKTILFHVSTMQKEKNYLITSSFCFISALSTLWTEPERDLSDANKWLNLGQKSFRRLMVIITSRLTRRHWLRDLCGRYKRIIIILGKRRRPWNMPRNTFVKIRAIINVPLTSSNCRQHFITKRRAPLLWKPAVISLLPNLMLSPRKLGPIALCIFSKQ